LTWTEAQARALITDPGTLKRGQELAAPTKWSNLGQTETAAWGECKGSGSKPYQTGIDLTEPAFKCSCPSRVFPCKHGAGLLLLLARQPQLLNGTTPPPWLQEWLDKRQQTQSKKPAKPAEEAAVISDDAAASTTSIDAEIARKKREAQRLSRMQQGATELETWLVDLMRAGLAAAQSQLSSFWESQAARLVDNQLPGLATVLRDLTGVRHQGPAWPERLLGQVGELYLLARTARNLEQLPAETRQEILQQLGVSSKKEEVLATQPAVADQWLVLSQTTTEEERLLVRRSWLQGQETDRFALIVEFSFGGQAFSTPLLLGGRYAGSVTFYPGLLPVRAVPGELTFLGTSTLAPVGGTTPALLLEAYAAGLARHPWLRELPVVLAGGVPWQTTTGAWVLRFSTDDLAETSPSSPAATIAAAGPSGAAEPGVPREVWVPLACNELDGWQLRAVSGGYPLTVFGEWTGAALRPLSYWPSPVATVYSA
jgi:hypothetical protein